MNLSHFAIPLVVAFNFVSTGYSSDDNPAKDSDHQRRDDVVDTRGLKKNKVDPAVETKPRPVDEHMMRANQLPPLKQVEQEALIARANANDEDAQNEVLVRVYGGILSSFEKITPQTWAGFSDKAQSDDLYCYTALKLMNSRKIQYDSALFAPLEARSHASNSLAQHNLGYAYLHGIGVKQDLKAAFNLFQSSVRQGNVNAAYQLGQTIGQYFRSVKTEIPTQFISNKEKAYKFAAQQGHSDACYELARTEEDTEKKKALLIKAANRGHIWSMVDLHADGKRVLGLNENEIFQWLLKSAEYGDAYNQNEIGFIYEEGKGVEKNVELAYKWYRIAAQNGSWTGMANLGSLYHRGQGVEQDFVKAFELYHKSANDVEREDNSNTSYGLLEHRPYIKSDNPHLFQEKATQLYRKATELTAHFEMKTIANNPDNGFREAQFALDALGAIYTPLFEFGDQLSKVLKPLASVGPGFQVSCVEPCEELADACWVEYNPESLSYDGTYTTFGKENVQAARQFSAYLDQIDRYFRTADDHLARFIKDLHPPIATLHAYQRAAISGNPQTITLFEQEKQNFDQIMELNKPEIDQLVSFRQQLPKLNEDVKSLISSTTHSRNTAFFESDEFEYLEP